jgi:hypothetical protein
MKRKTKKSKSASRNLQKSPASRKNLRPKRRRRNSAALRAPLTIALSPDSYRFIQACAERKAFRNVDDLFEAALLSYQRQSDALHAYIDMQIDKGFAREEILDSLRVEFVFTQPRRTKSKKSKRVKRS